MDAPCPDCGTRMLPHPVSDHDMYGCTRKECECELTGSFLIIFFAEES